VLPGLSLKRINVGARNEITHPVLSDCSSDARRLTECCIPCHRLEHALTLEQGASNFSRIDMTYPDESKLSDARWLDVLHLAPRVSRRLEVIVTDPFADPTSGRKPSTWARTTFWHSLSRAKRSPHFVQRGVHGPPLSRHGRCPPYNVSSTGRDMSTAREKTLPLWKAAGRVHALYKMRRTSGS